MRKNLLTIAAASFAGLLAVSPAMAAFNADNATTDEANSPGMSTGLTNDNFSDATYHAYYGAPLTASTLIWDELKYPSVVSDPLTSLGYAAMNTSDKLAYLSVPQDTETPYNEGPGFAGATNEYRTPTVALINDIYTYVNDSEHGAVAGTYGGVGTANDGDDFTQISDNRFVLDADATNNGGTGIGYTIDQVLDQDLADFAAGASALTTTASDGIYQRVQLATLQSENAIETSLGGDYVSAENGGGYTSDGGNVGCTNHVQDGVSDICNDLDFLDFTMISNTDEFATSGDTQSVKSYTALWVTLGADSDANATHSFQGDQGSTNTAASTGIQKVDDTMATGATTIGNGVGQ